MRLITLKRLVMGLVGILSVVMVWGSPVSAQKILPLLTTPLPQPAMPVLDLANLLTDGEEQHLNEQLAAMERDTGWKLRLLTQFDQSPGRQVKEYWDLNEKSVLMVADPKGGNLLAFNVGDAVRTILPRTFWIELQSRFGNQFF
ncbi:MAG: TPM domain-containing protein, partial [Thermostichales cyanobacterium GMQP_bins_62]